MRELRDLLWDVQAKAGPLFSGVGLLVCNEPTGLPLCPLRQEVTLLPTADLAADLASISVPTSALHDGFHVVSTTGRLLRVAQYFSPPMAPNATIDYRRFFGGRYLAALFGSSLPAVVRSGIASTGFGIALFEDGKEVHFERIP